MNRIENWLKKYTHSVPKKVVIRLLENLQDDIKNSDNWYEDWFVTDESKRELRLELGKAVVDLNTNATALKHLAKRSGFELDISGRDRELVTAADQVLARMAANVP